MPKFFLSYLLILVAFQTVRGNEYITWPELDPAECGTRFDCSYRFIEMEEDFYFHDTFNEGLVPVLVWGESTATKFLSIKRAIKHFQRHLKMPMVLARAVPG